MFGVWGLGFGVYAWGLRFGVSGLRFRIWGLGLRVQGSGNQYVLCFKFLIPQTGTQGFRVRGLGSSVQAGFPSCSLKLPGAFASEAYAHAHAHPLLLRAACFTSTHVLHPRLVFIPKERRHKALLMTSIGPIVDCYWVEAMLKRRRCCQFPRGTRSNCQDVFWKLPRTPSAFCMEHSKK